MIARMGENKPQAFLLLEQMDKNADYIAVKSTKKLREFVTALNHEQKGKLIAFDTETTGVDVITDRCLGYSFSLKPHTAYWVSIRIDPTLCHLKRLLNKRTVIMFNAGFDLAIIERYGIVIPDAKVCDVMIGCFFRDVLEYKHNAGLKKQAELILSHPSVTLAEIMEANLGTKPDKNQIDFTSLTPDQQRIYAAQDADITLRLWQHKSIQDAIEQSPVIWELEHQMIRPAMEMHRNGVKISVPTMERLDAILEKECEQCNVDALKLALCDCKTRKATEQEYGNRVFINEKLARLTKKQGLNLGSTTQKQILLFDELKLPHTRKTATGYSCDQEALGEIEDKHPIIPILMRYSKLVSRRNSYTKKLPTLVHPVDGRVHPSLWSTGVKSGRWSCSNPNFQGISKDSSEDDPVHIREGIVAEKGHVLTSMDYSQIELRIAGSLSQEPVWCKAYHIGTIDVHKQTAAEMWGITLDKVAKHMRDTAKTANFSILTGIGAQTLSARNRKTIPTVEDAQDLIDRWLEALPTLKDWIRRIHARVRLEGQMTTVAGRIRPFPDARKPNEQLMLQRIGDFKTRPWAANKTYAELCTIARRAIVSSCERKALSHIIQGTAADIMKEAINRVRAELLREKMPVKMLLTVHDSLLFEHVPYITDEFHALLCETATFPAYRKNWVPLTVGIGVGKSWAEADENMHQSGN